MDRKLWLSIIAAMIGASLLVAAATAAPAKNQASKTKHATKGGTYVVEFTTDVDYTDPALDYLSTGWEMMYVTACKLYNFPDKEAPAGSQLQPEVAAGLPVVSNGGKTYKLTLRKGLTYSDGSPVKASDFAYTIERAEKLNWGGKSFYTGYIKGALLEAAD